MKKEKIELVNELKEKIENKKVILIANIFKMPTKELQKIKKNLEGLAEIKIVKKNILIRALKSAKKEGLEKLEKFLPNQSALILTNEDPFKLSFLVEKLKSKTFARPGDIAPEEIKIPAGVTQLAPGPAISELAKAGLAVGVEGGKIAIKKEKVLVKRGEEISAEIASILRKLNIAPIDVSLKIVAAYENGKMFLNEILKLVSEYPQLIAQAHQKALNLSTYISYPTKENINYLLAKAYLQAKVLERIGGAK